MRTDYDLIEWVLAMAAAVTMLLAGSVEHAVLASMISYLIVKRDRP